MDLPDIKQLKKIIALCQKTKVQSIEINGFKIVLSDQALEDTTKVSKTKSNEAPGIPESFDELTEEEKIFWSSDPTVKLNTENNS